MQVVVDAVKRLNRWNEQRYKLIQLYHEREEILNGARKEVEGIEKDSAEYLERLKSWDPLFRVKHGEIGKIETAQAIRRAHRWRVPYPPTPDQQDDSEYWVWSPELSTHILTLEGHKLIRHAVATEMDIKFRPWLSWGAFAVSWLSLGVALLR